MHLSSGSVPVLTASLASLWLVVQRGDRKFALLALAASGVWALLALGVVSLSIARFHLDVILPALLAVGGAGCWTRALTKSSITAATVATLIGALQIVHALRLLG